MATVPRSNADKVSYFEAQRPVWAANADAIGTTEDAVADLQAKADAARAALLAQAEAQSRAQAATLAVQQSIDALAAAGAAIIGQVRAKAKTSGDGVYTLARVPAPASPSASAPPGTPTAFATTLNPDGTLGLTWKCTNPAGGVMYQVARRVGAEGAFVYIGGSGERRFTDVSIPPGTSQVTYEIQAIRSTAVGQPAQFVVNFATNNLVNRSRGALMRAA